MNRSKKHADRFHLEFHRQKHLVRWAKKIGLSSYQKLSVLLVQSITRGSTDLFLRLKEEEEGAFFEKKEQAKRKGEQASTKTARTDDGNVGCYLSIIDVSSTIYIFIKGQGVKHMRNFLKHFFKDESGMGVVEVILIICSFDRTRHYFPDTDQESR